MTGLTLGLSRAQAVRARKFSVGLNVVGFLFFVLGDISVAAWIKIAAEGMRIPYFEHTNARDMIGLAFFFIAGSLVAIAMRS